MRSYVLSPSARWRPMLAVGAVVAGMSVAAGCTAAGGAPVEPAESARPIDRPGSESGAEAVEDCFGSKRTAKIWLKLQVGDPQSCLQRHALTY